jgi:ABC-type amino acid transport substrate-binding protein
MTRRQAVRVCLLLGTACAVRAEEPATSLRLARLEAVPDQTVGAELLRAVYRHLGIRVEFVDLPAKRALLESSSGHIDGEVQRVPDVAREYPTLLPVREPINFIEPTAFVKRRGISVDGWASLRPYIVGIVRGVGSSERGTKDLPRVERANDMDALMKMLSTDRIDVAVNDRFSGLLVNKRLGLDAQLQPLSPPLQHIDLYHFLHERHRELVPRVEAQIRSMRSSGELERLREELTEEMLRDPFAPGGLRAR